MLAVLGLFLIPVGGGIPAGVLLARKAGLAWPVTAGLYFVSDVILAFAFEPILRLNAFIADPETTVLIVLEAMIVVPLVFRRLKSAWVSA